MGFFAELRGRWKYTIFAQRGVDILIWNGGNGQRRHTYVLLGEFTSKRFTVRHSNSVRKDSACEILYRQQNTNCKRL